VTLSPQELRLQKFCRAFSGIYFLGALAYAAFPGLTFRLATLGGETALLDAEARFWNAHGVALLVAMAVSCAVVAARPRERRHALLPVVAALLASSGLALVHGVQLSGPGARALWALVLLDFPLFLLTLFIYRSASPGVHSAPATQLPEKPAEGKPAAPVQLGVGPKAG
jgi:hypothetical protein